MYMSFEFQAEFGDTLTDCDASYKKSDNGEIIGGKFSETTTNSINDILQDDGQIGVPLTTETNQSSGKKVTDTASLI